MSEKFVPRDNPEQLSLEDEAGTVPPTEAFLEREINKLVDHGFNPDTARRMVGVSPEDSETDEDGSSGRVRQEQHPRPGYIKDGSRRRIKTPADARAADRLPDEDWRYR